MKTTRTALALTVAGLVLAGGAGFARSTPAAPTTALARASLSVAKSDFGQIVVDGRGYALYVFTADPRGKTKCYGACAKAWPPFIVKAKPAVGNGTKASLIGTTRRSDGKLQATYAGRPLYYYIGDNGPGIVRCQNVSEFGGLWLVVRGSGKPVR